MKMSLTDNKTAELWHSFMTGWKATGNNPGPELFSVQFYDSLYFCNFYPDREFVKWASVELKDFDRIPEGMESFILPGGLYAVFIHKGAAATGPATFHYIFGTWLPASDYILDDRPHFEILGEKYKNDDPSSEEEIWIPVKCK